MSAIARSGEAGVAATECRRIPLHLCAPLRGIFYDSIEHRN
jgi:hypothetical protein